MVVNKELAHVLEMSEVDCLHSRLTAIKELEGNPMGVDIQTFGSATAFSVKNIPGPSFNTVKGLKDGDEKYIDRIIDFYNEKSIPLRFELAPGHVSSTLLTYLSEKGFYQNDFHTTLYANSLVAKGENELAIRELRSDEFDTFAEIYTRGFQMPSFLKNGVAQNNEVLHDKEEWTFYLACIEDEPAGIGVLFIKDNVATLAAAATTPQFRKKGIQRSLIKHRIYQAFQKGCILLVSQARFGSTSQNNLERAGFNIGYTKSIWIKK
ncbi:GNAT family N-acetyltransferase [Robertmurraya yapensis]|uniref:GNAT family N-acetyltransferase n=1 Tax=Bacillus yapensis TaxID=2492960 RepID=A0A431W263_9BACI|nr:GNAT family N-acetyltransferase [Bacillus yapensis]RTR29529.1 GNAT family N-acetyltransferase [Bacillus yapensis]TKS94875.1 GNAT family N-acetyltransferase [Bacillus yapensis]